MAKRAKRAPKRVESVDGVTFPVPQWPPAAIEEGKGEQKLVSGQPVQVTLRRFAGDRALRGLEWTSCCGCGMTHLIVYELFADGESPRWYLNTRSYSIPGSAPDSVKASTLGKQMLLPDPVEKWVGVKKKGGK